MPKVPTNAKQLNFFINLTKAGFLVAGPTELLYQFNSSLNPCPVGGNRSIWGKAQILKICRRGWHLLLSFFPPLSQNPE